MPVIVTILGNARLALAALAVLLCGGLLASGIAAASSAPSQVQASVLGPTPTPTALPCIVNTGSITNGDPTQAGIVNRLFSPSVCLPSRSCPGLADTTPRHYDAYTFMVTAGNSQCVTISVDTSSCSGNLYSVAYRGSYNPADPCASFAGDTGDVVNGSASYNFMVSGSSTFIVVVHEFTPGSGCPSYTLTLRQSLFGCVFTSPTGTVTRTATPTPTFTPTPSATLTPTSTPTNPALLAGHGTWQGRPPQPHPLQSIPITLTLKMGSAEVNYPTQNTDVRGYFTNSVGSLTPGMYNWRVKGPKFLANAGTVLLTGALTTTMEVGLMLAADANNDNVVNATDFSVLRGTFGKAYGDPGYDDRADFNGDLVVNSSDFNLLRNNFGMGGAPPIGP